MPRFFVVAERENDCIEEGAKYDLWEEVRAKTEGVFHDIFRSQMLEIWTLCCVYIELYGVKH